MTTTDKKISEDSQVLSPDFIVCLDKTGKELRIVYPGVEKAIEHHLSEWRSDFTFFNGKILACHEDVVEIDVLTGESQFLFSIPKVKTWPFATEYHPISKVMALNEHQVVFIGGRGKGDIGLFDSRTEKITFFGEVGGGRYQLFKVTDSVFVVARENGTWGGVTAFNVETLRGYGMAFSDFPLRLAPDLFLDSVCNVVIEVVVSGDGVVKFESGGGTGVRCLGVKQVANLTEAADRKLKFLYQKTPEILAFFDGEKLNEVQVFGSLGVYLSPDSEFEHVFLERLPNSTGIIRGFHTKKDTTYFEVLDMGKMVPTEEKGKFVVFSDFVWKIPEIYENVKLFRADPGKYKALLFKVTDPLPIPRDLQKIIERFLA